MWEFSLFFPRELLLYFDDLKTDLKQKFHNQNNCISIGATDNDYTLMIALTKQSYNDSILYIKEKIAEIILLYYKPKTIINSINNFDINSHDNIILIDILSSFEHYEDKNEIIKNLSLIERLYLKSFVEFKLNFLLNKWKDVANLINQNSLFLLDDAVKKELMQFLMEGIVSKTHHIKLLINGNNVDVYSLNNNKFEAIKSQKIYYSMYDYDNLLFSLIKHYPKVLEVEHYKNFDIAFIQNLSDLFGSRLRLIE